jgi:hypothetical protein
MNINKILPGLIAFSAFSIQAGATDSGCLILHVISPADEYFNPNGTFYFSTGSPLPSTNGYCSSNSNCWGQVEASGAPAAAVPGHLRRYIYPHDGGWDFCMDANCYGSENRQGFLNKNQMDQLIKSPGTALNVFNWSGARVSAIYSPTSCSQQ